MCYGCWEEAGKPTIVNDRVLKAVEAVKKMYETHSAGGGLHIVTDDWNLEDDNVKWCREYMTTKYKADASEMACLEAFEALSEEERYSTLALEQKFFVPAGDGPV